MEKKTKTMIDLTAEQMATLRIAKDETVDFTKYGREDSLYVSINGRNAYMLIIAKNNGLAKYKHLLPEPVLGIINARISSQVEEVQAQQESGLITFDEAKSKIVALLAGTELDNR